MSAPPPPLPRRERPSIPLPTPPDRHFSAPIEAQSPPFITSPAPSSSSAENNTMLPVPDLSSGEANFGSCLQSSYEAISKRHEEELHALESFRGHVFKRQRADKEYAEQLLRINQASERAAQFPHSTTSPIVQARRERKSEREGEREREREMLLNTILYDMTSNLITSYT